MSTYVLVEIMMEADRAEEEVGRYLDSTKCDGKHPIWRSV